MHPSSLRKSITPESSVHTPVTVHTPLDEPDEDDIMPEREEDEEALPVQQLYVSPLRSMVCLDSSSKFSSHMLIL